MHPIDPSLALQVGQLLAITFGAFMALLTYGRDLRQKRTEWIYRLYLQFYENERYKPIRHLIDYEQAAEIKSLKSDIESGTGSDLHEAFVDYLNFFEYIAVQIHRGNLNRSEVFDIFDYYIRRLKDHEFVPRYLGHNGFENLMRLLNSTRAANRPK